MILCHTLQVLLQCYPMGILLLGTQSPVGNGALLATVAPPVVRSGLSQTVPCDGRWCSPAAPDDGLAVVGFLPRCEAVAARWLIRYTLGYAGSQVMLYSRTRSARF